MFPICYYMFLIFLIFSLLFLRIMKGLQRSGRLVGFISTYSCRANGGEKSTAFWSRHGVLEANFDETWWNLLPGFPVPVSGGSGGEIWSKTEKALEILPS